MFPLNDAGESPPRTLILGLGNTLLTDEALGVVVIRRLEAEGGVQDRSLESQIWDSGANFCCRAEVFLERERSTAGIGFECGRSLAPNYSADFYMDYILRGKWDWKVTEKDRLRFELGSRWNDFERYPADWEAVMAILSCWAATKLSSRSWATFTARSRPMMRAAPLMEWAARMSASSMPMSPLSTRFARAWSIVHIPVSPPASW